MAMAAALVAAVVVSAVARGIWRRERLRLAMTFMVEPTPEPFDTGLHRPREALGLDRATWTRHVAGRMGDIEPGLARAVADEIGRRIADEVMEQRASLDNN
jgi:hypothetical protein